MKEEKKIPELRIFEVGGFFLWFIPFAGPTAVEWDAPWWGMVTENLEI
jgi:hypothetical protein